MHGMKSSESCHRKYRISTW